MPLEIKTFPELVTERLHLRLVKHSDAPEIFFLRTDAEHNKFIKRPVPKSYKEVKIFIDSVNRATTENKSIYWGIALKDSQQLIGAISLWNFSEDLQTAEVGYDLHSTAQGKGIMTEALLAVLEYGFNTLSFKIIEAFTHFQNKASITMLEKNGFQIIANKEDKGNKNNRIFSITAEKFNE